MSKYKFIIFDQTVVSTEDRYVLSNIAIDDYMKNPVVRMNQEIIGKAVNVTVNNAVCEAEIEIFDGEFDSYIKTLGQDSFSCSMGFRTDISKPLPNGKKLYWIDKLFEIILDVKRNRECYTTAK